MQVFHSTCDFQQLASRRWYEGWCGAKEAYQFKPPNIPVVPQVLSEVHVIHEIKDEGRWMFWGRTHSDERHDVLALETTASQRLSAKPLPISFQPQDTRG